MLSTVLPFSKDELATYVSMIGDDDWCINYDKDNRMCKIYETRPEFCVVDPRKFKTMFGVEQEDLNVRTSLLRHLISYSTAQCFQLANLNFNFFAGFLQVLLHWANSRCVWRGQRWNDSFWRCYWRTGNGGCDVIMPLTSGEPPGLVGESTFDLSTCLSLS